jgi:hypothetical protein
MLFRGIKWLTLSRASAVPVADIGHALVVKVMKTLITLVLIVAAILTTHLVTAAGPGDRPHDVEETHWIPISERFGFVVAPKTPMADARLSRQILVAPPEVLSAEHMPPLKGYFVVKTEAGWRRLVAEAPFELSQL